MISKKLWIMTYDLGRYKFAHDTKRKISQHVGWDQMNRPCLNLWQKISLQMEVSYRGLLKFGTWHQGISKKPQQYTKQSLQLEIMWKCYQFDIFSLTKYFYWPSISWIEKAYIRVQVYFYNFGLITIHGLKTQKNC